MPRLVVLLGDSRGVSHLCCWCLSATLVVLVCGLPRSLSGYLGTGYCFLIYAIKCAGVSCCLFVWFSHIMSQG